MLRRLAALAMTCGVALASAGCLVETREVDDPRPAFDDARATAARLQGRLGPARRLNVLAYDPADHELTRVSLPLGLARRVVAEADEDARGGAGAQALRRWRGRDLERLPLGALVEAQDGDERVLIWLE